MKKQKKKGESMDKTLDGVASVNLQKNEKIQTDRPLAEKDEVKQAEERQRKRMKDK